MMRTMYCSQDRRQHGLKKVAKLAAYDRRSRTRVTRVRDGGYDEEKVTLLHALVLMEIQITNPRWWSIKVPYTTAIFPLHQ